MGKFDPIRCKEPGCGALIYWDMAACPVCYIAVEPPNVRWARSEQNELERRYREACAQAALRGCDAARLHLEEAAQNAKAVVSYGLEFALTFARGSTIHQSYHKLVSGGFRRAAAATDDIHRGVVDCALFGSFGERIVMSALSADGRGLTSYGPVFFELRDAVCRSRASLLIENSFPFVDRYGIDPAKTPEGFRAIWQDRAKLAVVKLGPRLEPATTREAIAAIILEGTGDRATDQFMEVHIYGSIDLQGVAKVRGPGRLADPAGDAYLRELQDRLRLRNIVWEDQ